MQCLLPGKSINHCLLPVTCLALWKLASREDVSRPDPPLSMPLMSPLPATKVCCVFNKRVLPSSYGGQSRTIAMAVFSGRALGYICILTITLWSNYKFYLHLQMKPPKFIFQGVIFLPFILGKRWGRNHHFFLANIQHQILPHWILCISSQPHHTGIYACW